MESCHRVFSFMPRVYSRLFQLPPHAASVLLLLIPRLLTYINDTKGNWDIYLLELCDFSERKLLFYKKLLNGSLISIKIPIENQSTFFPLKQQAVTNWSPKSQLPHSAYCLLRIVLRSYSTPHFFSPSSFIWDNPSSPIWLLIPTLFLWYMSSGGEKSSPCFCLPHRLLTGQTSTLRLPEYYCHHGLAAMAPEKVLLNKMWWNS